MLRELDPNADLDLTRDFGKAGIVGLNQRRGPVFQLLQPAWGGTALKHVAMERLEVAQALIRVGRDPATTVRIRFGHRERDKHLHRR